MGGYWGGIGIAGVLSILGSLLFVVLIVVALVVVVRTVSRRSHPAAAAQQILAERFARGEIDAEEYQERLRILNGEPPPSAQP